MTDTTSIETQTQTLEVTSLTEVEAKPKAKTIVKVMAIITPLLSFAVQNWVLIMAIGLGGGVHSIDMAMLGGSLTGVFLMPLVIMLLFQVGKRFRNHRSRWIIFLGAAVCFLAVSCLSAFVKLLV